MIAVDYAYTNKWKVWFESDSKILTDLVVLQKDPPWKLLHDWSCCKKKLEKMDYYITHVFREGNQIADRFANMGVEIEDIVWWNDVPGDEKIRILLRKERLGFPNYRYKPT